MSDAIQLNGHAKDGGPLAEQPQVPPPAVMELARLRKELGEAMGQGMTMDPSPLANPNLLFGINHDGAVLDALASLLVKKGIITDAEFLAEVIEKMAAKVAGQKAYNDHLRHRPVIAKAGRG